MNFSVKDGTGTSQEAKVSDKRIWTFGTDKTVFQQAILEGNGYNLSTGLITLTSASESGLFYIKNNEEYPIIIKEILVVPQSSTGGTGNGTARIYRNPTTGTLISTASAATQSNRLFSSNKTLTANIYKGAEGHTITDGTTFSTTSRSTFSEPIAFDAEIIVLEKGNSIAVSWQPPASNTSQVVAVGATVVLEVKEYK